MALYLALSRGLKLPLVRLLIVLGLVHLFLRYAFGAGHSGRAEVTDRQEDRGVDAGAARR